MHNQQQHIIVGSNYFEYIYIYQVRYCLGGLLILLIIVLQCARTGIFHYLFYVSIKMKKGYNAR